MGEDGSPPRPLRGEPRSPPRGGGSVEVGGVPTTDVRVQGSPPGSRVTGFPVTSDIRVLGVLA